MAQIIWTNHLKDRLKQRSIDPYLVEKAVRFPDKVIKSPSGSFKHIKNFPQYQVIAVVKHDSNDWIITSIWRKPAAKIIYHQSLFEKLIKKFVSLIIR